MKHAAIVPIAMAALATYATAAERTAVTESVTIKHYNFNKVDKDAQMWRGLYVGSNGKVYIGLCTHGDAANVYEFDPKTEKMRHLANITDLAGERGKGVWTKGKIHAQMQEMDGYVYFGTLDEDNGPPVIDANSYQGPHWYRIHMETGRVEQLAARPVADLQGWLQPDQPGGGRNAGRNAGAHQAEPVGRRAERTDHKVRQHPATSRRPPIAEITCHACNSGAYS